MLAHKLQEAAGNSTQPSYIEDVFSTYLYNAGSPKTIVNGIDLAGKGGMVWTKWRSGVYGAISNSFWDTVRGVKNGLVCPSTAAQATYSTDGVTSFNSDGFTAVATTEVYTATAPDANALYASWTFRKQPKFFDVVTYTGDGATNKVINHSLGSVPGCIMVKNVTNTGNWFVGHQGLDPTFGSFLLLNTTDAARTQPTYSRQFTAAPTSTSFSVTNAGACNNAGDTYVAYIFAHNAGGFGLTGTDNVISCGSFTTDSGGNATVNLGYEPQWVLMKSSSYATDWVIIDNMRGMVVGGKDAALFADLSSAEASNNNYIEPSATGFSLNPGAMGNSQTSIYIAIRRGPMKTPTTGTSVFTPVYSSTTPTSGSFTTGFPYDITISQYTGGGDSWRWVDRLRGFASSSGATVPTVYSNLTNAESSTTNTTYNDWNTGGVYGGYWNGVASIFYALRRAPGFFDEVCYTGDGASSRAITHNLNVAPELVISKKRDGTAVWFVGTGFGASSFTYLQLQSTNAGSSLNYIPAGGDIINAQPTSTTVTVDNNGVVNASGNSYVMYLFASCPGVSKVGSYTGNGSTQTINCGFTGGARFVLIKRTDAAGDWYVYDTARGMTTLVDPYLLLNSTAAESATLGSVTTVSGGFALNASILAAINTNGASYIYLAIA